MSNSIAMVLALVLIAPSSVLAQAITGAADRPEESAPFESSRSFDLRQSLEREAARLSKGEMAAAAAQTPQPSDREVREALAGNLCRCGTHIRILRAVEKAAKEMAS